MTATRVDLSDDDRLLLEQTAERIVHARMAVPAMMFFETMAPMNMVSSSMLRIMSPAWQTIIGSSRIDQVAELLERREIIPEFIRIIDTAEDARAHAAKEAKQAARAEKTAQRRDKTRRTPR
jgi:hypothetical protein